MMSTKSTLALFSVLLVPVLQAQDLPNGPGKDSLEKICTTCHDLSPVTSTNGDNAFWQSTADDMKGRGADGTDAEFRALVTYLTKYYGPPVKINTDTAASIQTNLGLTADEAAAIVKYRTDKGPFREWADIMKVPGLDMSKLAGLQGRVRF